MPEPAATNLLGEPIPAAQEPALSPGAMSAWPQERRLLWKRTKEDGVPLKTIAEAVGVSRPLLSQYLHSDSFKATPKLQAALADYFNSTGCFGEPDLFNPRTDGCISDVRDLEPIITETWKRIWFVLDHTLAGKNFGMITGPSGCGKTAAVRRWLKMRPGTDAVFISANGCMTRKSILRRIAKELGLYTKADADTLIERIAADLRQDSRLVIIDEADQICTELKLETLRSLIDGADGEAGIVLVGNEDLSEKILSMAVDKRKLARIHNRFGANQRVRMPTADEAARWLRRVNLAPGARKRLVKILMSSGGMGGWRVCRTILRTVFAAVGDGEITEELLLSDSLQSAVLSLNA